MSMFGDIAREGIGQDLVAVLREAIKTNNSDVINFCRQHLYSVCSECFYTSLPDDIVVVFASPKTPGEALELQAARERIKAQAAGPGTDRPAHLE